MVSFTDHRGILESQAYWCKVRFCHYFSLSIYNFFLRYIEEVSETDEISVQKTNILISKNISNREIKYIKVVHCSSIIKIAKLNK